MLHVLSLFLFPSPLYTVALSLLLFLPPSLSLGTRRRYSGFLRVTSDVTARRIFLSNQIEHAGSNRSSWTSGRVGRINSNIIDRFDMRDSSSRISARGTLRETSWQVRTDGRTCLPHVHEQIGTVRAYLLLHVSRSILIIFKHV